MRLQLVAFEGLLDRDVRRHNEAQLVNAEAASEVDGVPPDEVVHAVGQQNGIGELDVSILPAACSSSAP